MKQTVFKCDPLAPRAMLALQTHRDTYPDGMQCFNGRSNRALYADMNTVIYETKTTIVVNRLGG